MRRINLNERLMCKRKKRHTKKKRKTRETWIIEETHERFWMRFSCCEYIDL
jgi:hypothetical protein